MLAKGKKQKEFASSRNDHNQQNEIFRIAKQMVKERQNITGSNCVKGVSGKMIVDVKGIKDSWKEYMEKLMKKINGIIEYRSQLKKDQQIVSGSMKLLQH